jgi:S1-C subfamily serine protease
VTALRPISRAAGAASLALALALVLALGGCSVSAGDHGGGSSKRSAGQSAAEQAPAPRQGPVQKTRVKVIEGIGREGGFDPGTIYKRLAPGVVTVIAQSGASSDRAGLGSGFVLDGQGYIATNAHVVRGDPPKLDRASNVYVKFADGNRVLAKVVGDDLNADVALLKVNPAGLTLTPLRLGSSNDLRVGAPVAAIGSPFGESQSLSVGVISATGRDIESLTAFKIGNAIQTDAAINHGNSGGPLLDARGEVIGINSQIESTGGGGEGVGFAVPVGTVSRSLDELRAKGHVDYAYLGVTTQELYPQLAQRLGYDSEHGALVASVEPGGPAADAGIEAGKGKVEFQGQKGIPEGGDAIVAVDGRRITQSADLPNLISAKGPGDSVRLTVLRGRKRRVVTVKLEPRPNRPAPTASQP